MRYKNSLDFEKAVLGRHSGGFKYLNYKSFDEVMRFFLSKKNKKRLPHPPTNLGKLLYFGVCRQLQGLGFSPEGLIFRSSVGSWLDIHHFTDAFFYLPVISHYPITIDLFNLDSEVTKILRDMWESEYHWYPEESFQSNLFAHKQGLAEILWKSDKAIEKPEFLVGWRKVFSPEDLRKEGAKRPKNHFILTPEYVFCREKRKVFCSMVARAFAEALVKEKAICGD